MAKGKKTTGKNKSETVEREVTIDLDKSAHAALGEERGELLRGKANLDTQFAEVKDQWTARLEPFRTRLGLIDQTLKDGRETKKLECEIVKNYDENRVEYHHAGKMVDHREMSVEDRQDTMPLEEKKPKTRRGRDAKQLAANDKDLPEVDQDISNVRRLETSRNTKHTSTDGPAGKGQLNRDGAYTEETAPA